MRNDGLRQFVRCDNRGQGYCRCDCPHPGLVTGPWKETDKAGEWQTSNLSIEWNEKPQHLFHTKTDTLSNVLEVVTQKFKQALSKRSREKKEVVEYLLRLLKKDSLLQYVEWSNVIPENLCDYAFELLAQTRDEEYQLKVLAKKLFPEVVLKCNQKTLSVLTHYVSEKQMFYVLRNAFLENKPFPIALVSELFRNNQSWKEFILRSTGAQYLLSSIFGDRWSKAKLKPKDLLKRIRLCQPYTFIIFGECDPFCTVNERIANDLDRSSREQFKAVLWEDFFGLWGKGILNTELRKLVAEFYFCVAMN